MAKVPIGGDAINRKLNLYLVVLLDLLAWARPFLSALQVIQVVWSCPIRSCPTQGFCPDQNIVNGRKIKLTNERKIKLTNGPTFPSDAVMFLRCRLHGGASSSNSLCPQQLQLPLPTSVSRSSLASTFPTVTSSPTLRLPLRPSDGLC